MKVSFARPELLRSSFVFLGYVRSSVLWQDPRHDLRRIGLGGKRILRHGQTNDFVDAAIIPHEIYGSNAE